MFGAGEPPEIFRVTLDPTKNPRRRVPAGHVRLAHRRLHRRHPDHGDVAERPRRRRVGWRDRVRQHVRGLRRAHRRREGATRASPRRPHVRGLPTAAQPRSVTRGAGAVAAAAAEGAPAGVAPPLRTPIAGARRHRRRTSSAWTSTRVVRCSTTSSRGRPRPTGSTATVAGRRHGDLGQPRGAAPGVPLRPAVSPRTCTAPRSRQRGDPVRSARDQAETPFSFFGIDDIVASLT